MIRHLLKVPSKEDEDRQDDHIKDLDHRLEHSEERLSKVEKDVARMRAVKQRVDLIGRERGEEKKT